MRVFSAMLYKRKFLSFLTITFSFLTAAVTLWWNAGLSSIINAVSAGTLPTKEMLWRALGILLILGASNYGKGYLAGYTCEAVTHDLRMGYARHFTALSIAEIEKLGAGEQLSRLQNEMAGVSGYLNNNLFQLFDDALRFITTFVWLLVLSPTLTLAANLPAFLVLGYVFWSSKVIGIATDRSQHAKGQMNGYADTLLTLFPIIRLYDAARMTIDGFTGAVKTWENYTVKSERTRARLMSLSAVLSQLPLLLLFLVGGQLTINGVLSVGTLYIFLNLSGNVSGVLMNMPGHVAAFRQFSANMKRLSPYISLAGRTR
jgi:ABC-type multidrug transport system fused ATPase/permease subunit